MIFNQFPRVVRDLATSLNKQITLEMVGAETELDRTLVDAIKDPLTHIVRNSCDHGIESPEERIRQGKPADGRLLLRAFHEGGQVNIEIADDGAGIDPQRVRAKTVERGIMTERTGGAPFGSRGGQPGLPAGVLHGASGHQYSPGAALVWTS